MSSANGQLVKLKDIGTVELGPESDRSTLRYNGTSAVAIGVIRQSIAYAESAEKALSILEYRPDLGQDYIELADEVLARIGRAQALH